jgi:hypothetical protein
MIADNEVAACLFRLVAESSVMFFAFAKHRRYRFAYNVQSIKIIESSCIASALIAFWRAIFFAYEVAA